MKPVTVDEIAAKMPPIPKEVLDVVAQRFADAIDAQIVKEMLAR